jgi:hypothetical protein
MILRLYQLDIDMGPDLFESHQVPIDLDHTPDE